MTEPTAEFVALRSTRIRDAGIALAASPGSAAGPTIGIDDSLADALLQMVGQRCHRLAVRAGDGVVGVVDALDLLDWIARHCALAGIAPSGASLEGLAATARRVDALVASLHEGGLAVDVIARRVSELNRAVFSRLWTLVAPPELVAASCLLVMGSEGRAEQLLRTDQDNALLFRDGVDPAVAEAAALRFSAALTDFGYPPCEGRVMVDNPLWRQSLSSFRDTIRDWLYGGDVEGTLHLAIFIDARVVAGDARLLDEARAYLQRILSDNAAWLARFASAVDLFPEPTGWWARLATLAGCEEPPLDLKKHGTFPIVHGVRTLALQHRIDATPTTERLRQLVQRQQLPAELGRDLREVLQFLSGLRLQNNLRQRAAGEPLSQLVRPSELSLLDRNGLRDSLSVVQQLRQFLHQHFRMEGL